MMQIAMSTTSQNLRDADYSIEEEAEIYDNNIDDLLLNTRWYLDNLDYLSVYQVRWKNYEYSNPTLPYRYTKKANNMEEKE